MKAKIKIMLKDKKEVVIKLPDVPEWHDVATLELTIDGKVMETKRLYAGTHLRHGRLQLS